MYIVFAFCDYGSAMFFLLSHALSYREEVLRYSCGSWWSEYWSVVSTPDDGLMRPEHVRVLTTQMVCIIYSHGPASSKEATMDTNRFVH
jgi:hypothetical protein